MRVSRLEIFGFKSFVERFVLNFDKNFIGIVGPNGCGKSNVVDALRWVLGETHAKQLRGGVLEDLIFNGSDSRRPLGMAEVSITVRPHEGWAPATLHRLQELARSDKGEFDESQTEGIANETNPGEQASPEAKGDTGEKSAASRANSASTLLQLPGLFDAAEIQLTRRLYRSGESEYFLNRLPCRLRDMVEFYRIIGLGSRGLSIVQQGQVGSIVTAKPEDLRVLLEEAAGISGFRSRIGTAERRVEKTIENLSRLKDITAEVEKQVRSLHRQAKRASERKLLKEELSARELEYFKLKASLIIQRDEALTSEEGELEGRLKETREKIEVLAADLVQRQDEIMSIDDSLKVDRERRETLSASLREKRKREQQLKQNLARFESSARSNQFQRADVTSKSEQIANSLAKLQSDRDSAETNLKALEEQRLANQRLLEETLSRQPESHPEVAKVREEIAQLRETLSGEDKAKTELREVEHQISVLQREEREIERSLNEKRGQFRSAQAQVEAIQKQLNELARSVSESLSSSQQDQERGQILLSGIRVPAGYEKAVAAVLGEKAKYLVAEDPDALLQKLKVTSDQKSLGVIRSRNGDLQGASDTRLLSAHLSFEQWADATARQFLDKIYFAESVEQANAIRAEVGNEAIVVTRDGIIVSEWGWSVSGEKGLQSFRLARLLEEEKVKLDQCKSAMDEIQADQTNKRQVLESKQQAREDKRKELQSFEQIRHRLTALGLKERDLEKQQYELKVREERRVQELLRDSTSKCSAAKSNFDYMNRSLADLERERSRSYERKENLEREWNVLQQEFSSFVEVLKAELQEGAESQPDSEITSLEKLIEVGSHGIEFISQADLENEVLALESKLYEQESGLRKLRAALRNQEELKNQLSGETEKLNSELQSVKLQTERGKVELDLLKQEVKQKYGEDFELSFQDQFRAVNLRDLEQEMTKSFLKVEQLRTKLQNEGEVDPAVIEQYNTERERLASLENQLVDLEAAHKSLERSIRHLRELSRQKFVETFQDVSRRFGELVPKLFGGGSGEMALSVPEDPLNTGVTITVRPPGKKLRSLELLSGGEKALTAAAVLLAMFLHRPSPICVLDEVDAPLDDANLERFLSLLKEISQTTQLLMITHNKQSMLASDKLIGITMQEPGISKALTVSFEEAEAELDRYAANG